jgi:hypothetical protein
MDQMLDTEYTETIFNDAGTHQLPYSEAFTGTVTISDKAYNGNNPLAFYEKYITPTQFIDVDLNFESNKAKLYNVIIYDGDAVPIWKRKVVSGTALTEELLKGGPYGTFDIQSLEKSPTAEFKYILLPKWEIKDNKGKSETIESVLPVKNDYLVTKDIHIYAQY